MTDTVKSAAKEQTVYLGFRAPVKLKERIESLARRQDLTITQVVRQAVREYLARQRAA
jgi:predicted transcriptional regulator